MNLIINKTFKLKGRVTPPASKSHSIRAIFFALLSRGESVISNILEASDIDDACRVVKILGAGVEKNKNKLIIDSHGVLFNISDSAIYSGNSGLVTHFVMPLLGLRKNNHEPIVLDCGDQMRARPIKPLIDALIGLGLDIQYLKHPNQLPVRIVGELVGGKISISGETSQYLSALLLALPCAQQDSEMSVAHLQERPYVDMTLDYLKKHGIQYQHVFHCDTDIYFIKGQQSYQNSHTTIPIDFSSASYLIAAAVLIPGEVIIMNVDMQDSQGDKRLVNILQSMGADIHVGLNQLTIRGGKLLQGIDIDMSDIPDLLPTLAVIGTQAMGKTILAHVAHARLKETDRVHSMAEGLSRMGAIIEIEKEKLVIHQSSLHGNKLKDYGDHRTVMALSIAGMIADGKTVIDDATAIDKTFPHFIKLMQSLGANMEMTDVITS